MQRFGSENVEAILSKVMHSICGTMGQKGIAVLDEPAHVVGV